MCVAVYSLPVAQHATELLGLQAATQVCGSPKMGAQSFELVNKQSFQYQHATLPLKVDSLNDVVATAISVLFAVTESELLLSNDCREARFEILIRCLLSN
jgi:hypothetical protein